ncbi:MAG: N-acetylmuramoyl-L-alanine amidase family protein [Lachnospiraceae bacterium]|nr:N-acetylmuramoyl-L-alanine amidase family protein [Lachnospiraceae bacterium]
MKLSKKIIAILFTTVAIVSLSLIVNASVIYKDISSISIRTNFEFDYETLGESGILDDISFDSYSSTDTPSDNVNVYVKTDKYTIESCEWYSRDGEDFEIGGTPKIVVYLTTQEYKVDYNSEKEYFYRFLSSYSSSTCYISNATFVSATRLSSSDLKVVFALKPIKGTFNPPENAYWENDRGTARWDSPNSSDSGFYEIVLYRGQSVAARIDKYRGNSYNFSGYFNKEGDYSFKVRTVAGTDSQSGYGKSSEYVEAGSVYVSDEIISLIARGGGGGTSNSGSTNVGWVQMNNVWYFYRPDGEMVRNGWIQWQNNWYYLDDRGEMKVGVATINNRTYYLGSDGTMITGWVNLNDTYYYFDTTSGDNYGAMLGNSWIKYDNKYFYFDDKGVMVTGWKQIADQNGNVAFYYFYPKGTTNGLYGFMATNTTINGFQIGSDGRWIQS